MKTNSIKDVNKNENIQFLLRMLVMLIMGYNIYSEVVPKALQLTKVAKKNKYLIEGLRCNMHSHHSIAAARFSIIFFSMGKNS